MTSTTINVNDTGIDPTKLLGKHAQNLQKGIHSNNESEEKREQVVEQQLHKIWKDISKASLQTEKAAVKIAVDQKKLEAKEQLLFRIEKYFACPRFQEYLSKNGVEKPEQLAHMDVEQLHALLQRIKVRISAKGSDQMIEMMTKGCTHLAEQLITQFYDIHGYTDMLFLQQDFLDALECLKIEFNIPTLTATQRMLLIMSQTAIICHTMNQLKKHKEEQNSSTSKNASKSIPKCNKTQESDIKQFDHKPQHFV